MGRRLAPAWFSSGIRIVASAPTVERTIQEQTVVAEGGSGEWAVVVYDNPLNTFEEVILILMEATRCTLTEAEIETWEVHHLGKSLVHFGSEAECQKIAGVIRTIGITVEVRQESEARI